MSDNETQAVLTRGLHISSTIGTRLRGSVQPATARTGLVASADHIAMSTAGLSATLELILNAHLAYGDEKELKTLTLGPYLLTVGTYVDVHDVSIRSAAEQIGEDLREALAAKPSQETDVKALADELTLEDYKNLILHQPSQALAQAIYNAINDHRRREGVAALADSPTNPTIDAALSGAELEAADYVTEQIHRPERYMGHSDQQKGSMDAATWGLVQTNPAPHAAAPSQPSRYENRYATSDRYGHYEPASVGIRFSAQFEGEPGPITFHGSSESMVEYLDVYGTRRLARLGELAVYYRRQPGTLKIYNGQRVTNNGPTEAYGVLVEMVPAEDIHGPENPNADSVWQYLMTTYPLTGHTANGSNIAAGWPARSEYRSGYGASFGGRVRQNSQPEFGMPPLQDPVSLSTPAGSVRVPLSLMVPGHRRSAGVVRDLRPGTHQAYEPEVTKEGTDGKSQKFLYQVAGEEGKLWCVADARESALEIRTEVGETKIQAGFLPALFIKHPNGVEVKWKDGSYHRVVDVRPSNENPKEWVEPISDEDKAAWLKKHLEEWSLVDDL